MKSIAYVVAAPFVAMTLAISATASDLSSPAPEGAVAYIVSPQDGDTVKSPVKVVFGLKGMGVAPAGIELDNTGHHHLLIDKETLPAEGIPMGSDVVHFGKGQTEASVELEPGTHTLQLLLGNHLHVPHTPYVASEKITITVSD